MRRSPLRGRGRMRHEVAAILSVVGLAVMGRPLLAGGNAADAALTLPATAGLLASAPAVEEVPPATTTTIDPLAWLAPGGANQGTENVALALATIALQGNEPLYISDGWGRTWGSATSDHYVGNTDSWAIDVAVRGIQRPTPQTEEAARRIAAALGHPDWTGGDLKVTIDGYRFQILWKVAGHFNHVHIGVEKA